MNDAIENQRMSKMRVRLLLWRSNEEVRDRSSERLSCLSVHDDNGIEMMMMTLDADCPVIDIPTKSSSSSNPAKAAN